MIPKRLLWAIGGCVLVWACSVWLPMYRVIDAMFDEVTGDYYLVDIVGISGFTSFLVLLCIGAILYVIEYKKPILGMVLFLLYFILVISAFHQFAYLHNHELQEEYYAHIRKGIGYFLFIGLPVVMSALSIGRIILLRKGHSVGSLMNQQLRKGLWIILGVLSTLFVTLLVIKMAYSDVYLWAFRFRFTVMILGVLCVVMMGIAYRYYSTCSTLFMSLLFLCVPLLFMGQYFDIITHHLLVTASLIVCIGMGLLIPGRNTDKAWVDSTSSRSKIYQSFLLILFVYLYINLQIYLLSTNQFEDGNPFRAMYYNWFFVIPLIVVCCLIILWTKNFKEITVRFILQVGLILLYIILLRTMYIMPWHVAMSMVPITTRVLYGGALTICSIVITYVLYRRNHVLQEHNNFYLFGIYLMVLSNAFYTVIHFIYPNGSVTELIAVGLAYPVSILLSFYDVHTFKPSSVEISVTLFSIVMYGWYVDSIGSYLQLIGLL